MACCSPNSSSTSIAAVESSVPPQPAMSPKAHIHLHVPHLGEATAFYRTFFGSNPVKAKPGYAKFLPIWAPVNLALSEHEGACHGSVVSHLGIQLASSAAVQAHLHRIKAAGLAVREEMGVTCCHANQDKFWVIDPAGIEWEVYYLNFDVDQSDAAQSASSCCVR